MFFFISHNLINLFRI
jgi:hypothetical protein